MADNSLKSYKKIFTPQGELGKVQKNPQLNFLMNIFNIPRIFGVSGFGDWDVGKHSLCTAFIALYWAKYRKYKAEKRDKLVTLAITHDLHEAVTGDILPFFKTQEVRGMIDDIQDYITSYFSIEMTTDEKKELKLLDMISFLYEIHRSNGGNRGEGVKLLGEIEKRQREDIEEYAKRIDISEKNINIFLKELGIEE